MVTVVATGVFDILHPGHVAYLEEAKALGDRLVVILARDTTARKLKGRKPVVPQDQRLRMVLALKPVDDAVLGDAQDMFAPVVKIRPDIIALGPDQKFDEKELQAELKRRGLNCSVVRVKLFHNGSLSKTRKILEAVRSSGP
ncbi:FAD synthase [uncultured archaeon]|nr:FAD synthase [uncultured archaeon]